MFFSGNRSCKFRANSRYYYQDWQIFSAFLCVVILSEGISAFLSVVSAQNRIWATEMK
jgi:hypothetical protein